jgi:histidinol dehydrogenase
VVRRIIRDVREDGDNAVRYYNLRIDGAETTSLEVGRDEIEAAYGVVDAEVVEALKFAAERVRHYHEQQMRGASLDFNNDGLGQLTRAIERVGLYIPGTRAPLPSTVIMCAIPARVAGVDEIVMTSPVLPDGSVPPVKLVAADIAGISRIFRAGGAQGVAAFAYGTETIPRVDKICGPGGLFVAIAKKQVFGDVGIDALYGPTETVLIADESADPELVAADMLAQAEHDALATPILLTPSHYLADAVDSAITRQLRGLERAKIARESIDNRGGCILVNDIDHAIELANEFAPEHLCLLVEQPMAYAMKVRNAGGLFLGEASPEAFGDYTAGPSHTMPTGGSARWSSPLGVRDFLKTTSIVGIQGEVSEELARAASIIARAEGLTAHARAAERRLLGR